MLTCSYIELNESYFRKDESSCVPLVASQQAGAIFVKMRVVFVKMRVVFVKLRVIVLQASRVGVIMVEPFVPTSILLPKI